MRFNILKNDVFSDGFLRNRESRYTYWILHQLSNGETSVRNPSTR